MENRDPERTSCVLLMTNLITVPADTVVAAGTNLALLSLGVASFVMICLVTEEGQLTTSAALPPPPDPSGAASGVSSLLLLQAETEKARARAERERRPDFMGWSIRARLQPRLHKKQRTSYEPLTPLVARQSPGTWDYTARGSSLVPLDAGGLRWFGGIPRA